MDILFACRVCHGPLVASVRDRGAIVDCPDCEACQSISEDPQFGVTPSSYLQDGFFDELDALTPTPMLRRVRIRRDENGVTIRAEPLQQTSIPQPDGPAPDLLAMEAELERLRAIVTERDAQLAEWQTCHESVERELRKADERAAALQSKINATANELAQVRHDLAKSRSETEAVRKANDALNHQLQAILRSHQVPKVAPPAENPPGGPGKPDDGKGSNEIAA